MGRERKAMSEAEWGLNGVPGTRDGATVVKEGRSSEGHEEIQVPALFLIYWLVSERHVCQARWGPKATLGSRPNSPPDSLSFSLSSSCSFCLQIVLSTCVCPYLPCSAASPT